MLSYQSICGHRVSICPSQVKVVPKKLNARACNKATCESKDSSFIVQKISIKFPLDHPQRRCQMQVG